MDRYQQSGLLFYCPSHSQSTQTQLRRKSTHQEHPVPTATQFHLLWVGLGTRTTTSQCPNGPVPRNNTLLCKEEPRAGCLYQHSCGTEPSAERNPPVCTAHGATLAVQPWCSWQPQAAGKLCPPHQTTLQLDFTCNPHEPTALTQDCKDSSEEGIDSVRTPTTPWQVLDSKKLCPSSLQCQHWLYLRNWAGQSCQQRVPGVHNSFSSLHHYPAQHAHFPHLPPPPWGKPPNCSAGSLSE